MRPSATEDEAREPAIAMHPATATDIGQRVAARVADRLWPAPALADLVLTEECNHRCTYCFVKDKDDHASMSCEVAEASVDYMIRASRGSPSVRFVLFGGEPLIEYDLIRHLVEYARDHSSGCQVTFDITTNGTLMNEEMATFLSSNGIKFLLSLDGDRETHDAHRKLRGGGSSFDEVMSRLPMMKHYQPWQGARLTVHPEHAGRLYDNVRCLFGRGINQFIIGPATGAEWTAALFAEYERQMFLLTDLYIELKDRKAPFRILLFERDLDARESACTGQWGCGAGRGRLCIGTNGDIYGCAKILGVTSSSRVHRLGDIWNGISNLSARRDLVSNDVTERVKCKSCSYQDECAGGCPAVNWEATACIFDPAPVECWFTAMFHRLAKHYREKLSGTES